MPLLFSYGTLQLEPVQLATFGRKLHAQMDQLPSFELALVPITDQAIAEKLGLKHHQNVMFNGNASSMVRGSVLDVTELELHLADQYERLHDYRRILVTTLLGRTVWVYVHSIRPSVKMPTASLSFEGKA